MCRVAPQLEKLRIEGGHRAYASEHFVGDGARASVNIAFALQRALDRLQSAISLFDRRQLLTHDRRPKNAGEQQRQKGEHLQDAPRWRSSGRNLPPSSFANCNRATFDRAVVAAAHLR